MITLTPKAAEQIRASARQQRTEGLPLRLAAKRLEDGSIHYGMGFDDTGRSEDTAYRSEGIDIVVAPNSTELLVGTTLDFVTLDDGEERFVFLNPQDPNYAETAAE